MTATARQQLQALRGRRASAARAAIEDILARGCIAAGYRLAGAVLDHVCCRHLYGEDRLLTAWRARDDAMVLLVGPHSGKASDVYGQLLAAVGKDAPEEERAKPPCCEPGESPPVDPATVDEIVGALEAMAQPPRRRRPSG